MSLSRCKYRLTGLSISFYLDLQQNIRSRQRRQRNIKCVARDFHGAGRIATSTVWHRAFNIKNHKEQTWIALAKPRAGRLHCGIVFGADTGQPRSDHWLRCRQPSAELNRRRPAATSIYPMRVLIEFTPGSVLASRQAYSLLYKVESLARERDLLTLVFPFLLIARTSCPCQRTVYWTWLSNM